ncbi:MAG: xylose isomerase, partial [Clostridia bacterium]|nr:xylose isomerase [Clostridia bacterium]
IAGMDAFALGLIKAYEIIEDGRIDEFVAKRYASYTEGIGKDIREGKDDTIDELVTTLQKLMK